MPTTTLKLAKIGNSRGVCLPTTLLCKFGEDRNEWNAAIADGL